MNYNLNKQYSKETEIFKALSHPTRMFILHIVQKERLTVTELAEKSGIDISTMSKHLDILKRCKIIIGDKFKNNVYYKVNIPCIFNFLDCAKNITSCSLNCKEESCSNINYLQTDKQENLK